MKNIKSDLNNIIPIPIIDRAMSTSGARDDRDLKALFGSYLPCHQVVRFSMNEYGRNKALAIFKLFDPKRG